MLVVVIKMKTKKISRSSSYLLGAFPCKYFYFIFFPLWVVKEICPRGNNKVIIYFLIS